MTLPHRVASLAMQDRIQELLAKHKPIFKLDEVEKPSYPRTSLLRLPGELRNHIYEYALWHEDGKGMIAPAPDDREREYTLAAIRNDEGDGSKVEPDLEAGPGSIYRFKMHGDDLVPFNLINAASIAPAPGQDPAQAALVYTLRQLHTNRVNNEEIARPRYIIDLTAAGQPKHICTLDCLLQPALTLVSRSVRQDSLPVFYGVNRFHFEMRSFAIRRDRKGQRFMGIRSPIDWWRGAGDTNLRAINDLVLVNDGGSVGMQSSNSVAVVYKQRASAHSITVKQLLDPQKVHQQGTIVAQQGFAEMRLRQSDLYLSALDKTEEGGLHVRGLERLLAAFGNEKTYLVDKMSLL